MSDQFSNSSDEFDFEKQQEENLTLIIDLVPPAIAGDFTELFQNFSSSLFQAAKNIRLHHAGGHKDPIISFDENMGRLSIKLRDEDIFYRNEALRCVNGAVHPVMKKVFGSMIAIPEPVSTRIPVPADVAPVKKVSSLSFDIRKIFVALNIISDSSRAVPTKDQSEVREMALYRALHAALGNYFEGASAFFASEAGLQALERMQNDAEEEKEIQEEQENRLCKEVIIDCTQTNNPGLRLNGRDFYVSSFGENNMELCWFDGGQPGRQRLGMGQVTEYKLLPGIQFDFSRAPVLRITPVTPEATITVPRTEKGVKVLWQPDTEKKE